MSKNYTETLFKFLFFFKLIFFLDQYLSLPYGTTFVKEISVSEKSSLCISLYAAVCDNCSMVIRLDERNISLAHHQIKVSFDLIFHPSRNIPYF